MNLTVTPRVNPSDLSAVVLFQSIVRISAVLSFAEENNFIESGDVNSDSNINIQDIVLVINLILNSEYDYLADLNLDNIVDVLDIVQLVNLILN